MNFENLQQMPYSQLPFDSIAAAAMRIRHDYATKGQADSIDLALVLGDPSRGVSFPRDTAELTDMLIQGAKRFTAFVRDNESYLRERHEAYKRIFC